MKSRLASLFLLLVLFGGAFAGVPLSFGESQCSMGGSADMDCCKAALAQKDKAKFTQEEQLMCALSCAQNGTTPPASNVQVAPPSAARITSYPAAPAALFTFAPHGFHCFEGLHDPPGSPPTYLRNLALLI